MQKDDLKLIKEKYGENMMHLCRTLFPTLLETPGLLFEVLSSNFNFSKFLYGDIIQNNKVEDFKNYIYSLIDVEKKTSITLKTPKELLKEVGYSLYQCNTEEQIQYFKKYYAENEELCTFNGGRLNRCYVFFAVKKNVDEIKRENFNEPNREDEYGTSVISIQFTKDEINTLSIKNRYNHRVNNPDATFHNNLDNIIPGLTESFEKCYNFQINQNSKYPFELPNYVTAEDGKFYKYNYEIGNIYYCPNNIIIDNFKVVDTYQEKEKYVIMDYFVVDLVKKEINLYSNRLKDSFIDGIKNIKNISIEKENGNKILRITTISNNLIKIGIDKLNRIISYHNEELKEVKHYFLEFNKVLDMISLPNLEKTGDFFLRNNMQLKTISFPKLKQVGYGFLCHNNILHTMDLEKLEEVDDYFLSDNRELRILNLPYLNIAGDYFLYNNNVLKEVNLPNLKRVGDYFLRNNEILQILNLPSLKQVGCSFLCCNESLHTVCLPELEEVEDYFLYNNKILQSVNLPKLKTAGSSFLYNNNLLQVINLPSLKKVGDGILCHNESLHTVCLPELEEVGDCFLNGNNLLQVINLPKLKKAGSLFLNSNQSLCAVKLPELKQVGEYFLSNNKSLQTIYLPKLKNDIDFQLNNKTHFKLIKKNKFLNLISKINLKGRKIR